MEKDKYAVLIIDDSVDDRLFIKRAIQRNERFEFIGELEDGEAAIAYLQGEGQFNDRSRYPMPDALLLDLKMPRKTGHEVLEWLQGWKSNSFFVAVISGSILPEDVAQSLELGAKAHYRKSAMKEDLDAMLKEIASRMDEELQKFSS